MMHQQFPFCPLEDEVQLFVDWFSNDAMAILYASCGL